MMSWGIRDRPVNSDAPRTEGNTLDDGLIAEVFVNYSDSAELWCLNRRHLNGFKETTAYLEIRQHETNSFPNRTA